MIKEINLLPWRSQAYEQKKRQLTWALFAAIASGIVTIILAHYLIQLITYHYENKYKLQQQQWVSLDQRLEAIHQIQQQQHDYITQAKQLKTWQSQKNWLPQLINDLTKCLPDGIYLMQLKREGNIVLFNGRAESNAEVARFLQTINRIPLLQSPSLRQIQTQAITGFYDQHFMVQAFIKYPNED